MKAKGKWIGIALMILTMVSVQAMAQNGGGSNGYQVMTQNNVASGSGYGGNEDNGPHGTGYNTDNGAYGNGQCQSIRSRIRLQLLSTAEPVTITGLVVEAPYAGSGLVVDTESDDGLMTTVYGIGPQWYWDLLGYSKPEVGEVVIIDALQITLSDGTVRIIATTITIPGVEEGDEDIVVQLRDEDGRPLWRQVGFGLE